MLVVTAAYSHCDGSDERNNVLLATFALIRMEKKKKKVTKFLLCVRIVSGLRCLNLQGLKCYVKSYSRKKTFTNTHMHTHALVCVSVFLLLLFSPFFLSVWWLPSVLSLHTSSHCQEIPCEEAKLLLMALNE